MTLTETTPDRGTFKPLTLAQTLEALSMMSEGELDSDHEISRVARSAHVHLITLRQQAYQAADQTKGRNS